MAVVSKNHPVPDLVQIRRALLSVSDKTGLVDFARSLAELGVDVTSPAHKRSYLRVEMSRPNGRWTATPTGNQGSHVLTSIANADGLAEIPEDVTEMRAGERVRVNLLVDG